MVDNAFLEKRSFKRYPVGFSVALKDHPEKDYADSTDSVENISVGGMKIRSSYDMSQASVLYCKVADGQEKEVTVTGRIMWRAALDDEHYMYGMKFISIKPVDKFRLLQNAYQHFLKED